MRLADEPALVDLMERGVSRGFILLSELHDITVDLDAGDAFVKEASAAAGDQGIVVVDDLAPPDVGDEHQTPNPLSNSTDSVRQYLNAIGAVALLTPEEEVDLAKRDQAGRAATWWLDERPDDIPPRKRAMLRRIVRDGEAAQERMVCANLRLVVSVARRYMGRGLSLLELVQEGNLGLIRGVEKFDHTKGYKFSTYATWWIRQALTRGTANKARAVRLPVHVHEMVAKIKRVELEFLQITGRDPSDEELAEALDLTLDRMREIKLAGRDIASLDRPVGEDGDATMGDLFADEAAIDPEIAAAYELTRQELLMALDSLGERERGVLELRFGLADGECHTLEEIGEFYGVTRERIRQIEKKTLAKLRHPSRAMRLQGLLEAAAGGPPL